MERNRVHVGDARTLAAQLAPGSVQTIVTSPPYWKLRSYLPADHPDKGEELGNEATVHGYVQDIVDLFIVLRRALRDDGTVWLNIGDSYARTGGTDRSVSASAIVGSTRNTLVQQPDRTQRAPDGTPEKSLLGIPWRVAFALQDDGWWLRSDIIWAKPNPMPESVRDRPTRSHEYLFLLTKSPRYFYDGDAIREPHADPRVVGGRFVGSGGVNDSAWQAREKDGLARESFAMKDREYNPAGRNKRSVWTVTPAQFPGSHFATFPPDLVRPCLRAGTSERGCCDQCGAPWARVVERGDLVQKGHTAKAPPKYGDEGDAHVYGKNAFHTGMQPGMAYEHKTTGWQPSCTCSGAGVRPCLTLDPFMGSGTIAQVAVEEGRDWLGFDLDPRSIEWTAGRLRKLPVRSLFAATD